MTMSLSEAAAISAKYTPSEEERGFHRGLAEAFSRNMDADEGEGVSVGIQLLDRMISVIDMDIITADVWMEDDRDLLIQVLPAHRARLFPDWSLARPQWNNVLRKVFGDVPGVSALGEYFGPFTNELSVSRKSDPSDKGRDMFQVRLIGLWQRPRAVQATKEAISLYNHVLARREQPVE